MKSSKEILETVKKITGKGVRLEHEPGLVGAYGHIRIARKDMSEHILYYRLEKYINYTIAHECDHIIRMFNVRPEYRKLPCSTVENRRTGITQLETDIIKLSAKVPEKVFLQIVKSWYDGTIGWLESMPIDVKIEKWIYDNCPEIREEQQEETDIIMKEGATCTNRFYKQNNPKKVCDAMISLGYAYAICIDSILGTNYSNDYDKVFDEFGERVLKIVKIILSEDKGYEQDINNVDQIAKLLGLDKWYSWTEFL